MEVKTNADIHDTNISECDKEYSNGSANKSQHFLGHGRATNLIHRRRKSLYAHLIYKTQSQTSFTSIATPP
jgi:hypothetical protein